MRRIHLSAAQKRTSIDTIPVEDFVLLQQSDTNPGTTQVYGVVVSHDGLHLISTSDNTNTIYRRTVDTAYDISSVSGVADSANISQNYTGACFNDDGLKVYPFVGNNLQEYTLSSPYDITTMVTTGITKNVGAGFHTNPFFSEDGLTLWHNNGTSISEWTLTVPYDLSTIGGVVTNTLDLTPFHTNFVAWCFSVNGTKIYLVQITTPYLLGSLDLSEPFDITAIGSPATAVYNTGIELGAGLAIPRGMTINPNNGHLIGITDQSARDYFELGRA